MEELRVVIEVLLGQLNLLYGEFDSLVIPRAGASDLASDWLVRNPGGHLANQVMQIRIYAWFDELQDFTNSLIRVHSSHEVWACEHLQDDNSDGLSRVMIMQVGPLVG